MALKIENMKVGDKFIFHKCKANEHECEYDDFTIGKIYTVIDGDGGLEFKDDTDSERNLEMRLVDEGMKITKIKY
jgi:hypothetical protein